ncbi:MAG: uroporphyrinogen decarboxylase family protein [Phototrophicaceae bacterium]
MTAKLERLQQTVGGYATHPIPTFLMRHFPGDDQRISDHVQALIHFQELFDWDVLVIHPPSSYAVADYGVQSEWNGHHHGDRQLLKHIIQRSLDWTEIRNLDPERGELGKQLEVTRQLVEHFKKSVPILVSIYSPLSQATRLSGHATLLDHLRTRPDRLKSCLNVLTETTLNYVNVLRKLGVDGIVYIVEYGDYGMLAKGEYESFGVPYDLKILGEMVERTPFNLLHLRGNSPMFDVFKNYPTQATNWNSQADKVDLVQGKSLSLGAVCGGAQTNTLLFSTPSEIRQQANHALREVNRRRIILTAEDTVSIASPLANLKAFSQLRHFQE